MQIDETSRSRLAASMSILKSANHQPELAGELISRTIEGLMQMQSAQSPAQPIDISAVTGTGKIINITV